MYIKNKIYCLGFYADKNKILSISESRHEESREMRFRLSRADIFKPKADVIGDSVKYTAVKICVTEKTGIRSIDRYFKGREKI